MDMHLLAALPWLINDNEPAEDFHGARVELAQEVYASEDDTDTVYIKYEKDYAQFTIKNK